MSNWTDAHCHLQDRYLSSQRGDEFAHNAHKRGFVGAPTKRHGCQEGAVRLHVEPIEWHHLRRVAQ